MTEKRFTVHIKWFNYDKTEGEIELKDNGQPLLLSESVEDVQYIKTLLNGLYEKNQQLQIRNNRQAKQLDDLYRLIEQKDWRALSDILDDFKKADEQLQSEWQTYEDKND